MRRLLRIRLWALMIGWMALAGCDLYKPNSPEAAYLEILSAEFFTRTSAEGMPTYEITDVWVYANGAFIGVFELPARRIPIWIRPGGNVNLQIYAGCIADRIASQRVNYPFYKGLEYNLTMKAGEVRSLTPRFRYVDDDDGRGGILLPHMLSENFEETLRTMDTMNSVVPLERSNESPYLHPQGQLYSGLMRIPAGTSGTFQLASKQRLTITDFLRPLYLELDYRTTVPIQIGLYAYNANNNNALMGEYFDLNLRASDGWRKVYVNLNTEISYFLNVNNFPSAQPHFVIAIRGQASGTGSEYLAVDNVRLVSFR